MRSLLPLFLLLFPACGGRFRLDPKVPYEVLETPTTVALTGDVQTTMVVSYPAHRSGGPYPTVVLVPGFGPMDRDGTLASPLGATPFYRRLAELLTSRGFAVVRYDERHVRGPGDIDRPSYVADRDQRTFVADLGAVHAAARRFDRIDGDRVFLLGFDEGGRIAAQGATELDVAGLVLVGTPATGFRERLSGWFDAMELYLERFAYQGKLDGHRLAMALHANAADAVRTPARMLAVSHTRASDYAEPSPLVDRDRDGILELDAEVAEAIPGLLDLAFGPLGSWRHLAETAALPPAPLILASVDVPVLVVHGEHDAAVPSSDGGILSDAAANATMRVVPGVGHALGPAREPVDDLNRAFTPETLDPVLKWLIEQDVRS